VYSGGSKSCPVAGVWSTNWGDLELTVNGEEGTGRYPHDDGVVKGVLSQDGLTMTGTWSEKPSYEPPQDAGRIELHFSPGGESFSGVWSYGDGEPAGEWTGTKVPADAVVTVAGRWSTDFGILELKVAGQEVTGTYSHDGGRVQGALSADGTTLTGSWSEAPSYAPPEDAGTFVFTFSPDRSSFSGRWSYGDAEPSGVWNGTREQ